MKKMFLFLTGIMLLSIASNASLYAMKHSDASKKGINKKGLLCLGLLAFASMISGVDAMPTKEDCKGICNFESPSAQFLNAEVIHAIELTNSVQTNHDSSKEDDTGEPVQESTAMTLSEYFAQLKKADSKSAEIFFSVWDHIRNNHENYFPLALDAAVQWSKSTDSTLKFWAYDIYISLFKQEYAPALDAAAISAARWMASIDLRVPSTNPIQAYFDQDRAIWLYEELFKQDYPQCAVTDATAAVIRGMKSDDVYYQSRALKLLTLLVNNNLALDIARPIAIQCMGSSKERIVEGAFEIFTALVGINDTASFADALGAIADVINAYKYGNGYHEKKSMAIEYARGELIDALDKKRLLPKEMYL
jgi:hypothetical protein